MMTLSLSKFRGVVSVCNYFLAIFLLILCIKGNACQSKSLQVQVLLTGKSHEGVVPKTYNRNENVGGGGSVANHYGLDLISKKGSGSNNYKKQSRSGSGTVSSRSRSSRSSSKSKSRKMKNKEKDKNNTPRPVPEATSAPTPAIPLPTLSSLYTTMELIPMQLILTSLSDEFTMSEGTQVLKVLKVTKNHFQKNFKKFASSDVSLDNVSFEMEKPKQIGRGSNQHERRQRTLFLGGFKSLDGERFVGDKLKIEGEGGGAEEGKEKLSIRRRRHLSESTRITTKITGSATFLNDNNVPDKKTLENLQKQMFTDTTDDYTDSIEKALGDSITAAISFDNGGSGSTTDDVDKPKGGSAIDGTGAGAELGAGAGAGAGAGNVVTDYDSAPNAGGIAAGVICALAVIAIAVAIFIKFKGAHDNQGKSSKEQKQKQRRQLPFFNTQKNRNQNKNNIGDPYYDENQRYSVVYEMKNDRGNGFIYESSNDKNDNARYEKKVPNATRSDDKSNQGNIISPSNVIISNNDDGSVIEAVYASPVRLCSTLKSYCSASPRRSNHPSRSPRRIHQLRRSPRARNSPAVDNDTYSLDGSYAIDNEKPTNGDNMLSHVLSMSSYNGEHGLVSPDTVATTPSNGGPYHIEEVEEDESVHGEDLSTYSYSNVYSADCQSVMSSRSSVSVSGMSAMQKLGNMNPFNKRRTSRDIQTGAAAGNKDGSPSSPLRSKDCIIYENSPSNPGINVVSSHQRELMGTNESGSMAYSTSPQINLIDELSSHGSSSGILLNEGNEEDENDEILPTTNELVHNMMASPKREGIPDSHECRYNACQILPTEVTNTNDQNICRTSSIISGKRRQHKITITTSAPPPPRTPERFPLQSANPYNFDDIENGSAFSSDSESSHDEMNHFDFSPEKYSSQLAKRSSGKNQKQLRGKDKKKDVVENTNIREGTSEPNPFVEIHDTDRNYRRNCTNISANARNARRNRLGKSIERNAVIDNTSRAEIVSILRKSRMQRQQMARSQVNRRD